MKNITKYFRNAVLASSQCNIEYKDGQFVTLTLSDVREGKIEREKINFLWKATTECEADSSEEILHEKNVIIALKTISSVFTEGGLQKTDIKDMTSIFFLPAKVSQKGDLDKQDEKYPWIPREYLAPMIDPVISIGRVDDYDKFLENSTDKRNQIVSWEAYFDYAIEMFEAITKSDFSQNIIINAGKEQISTDGKFYIFEDTTVNSTSHILQTYNHLLEDEETKLYAKVTNGLIEPSKKLCNKLLYENMKYHCGQMGGEYSLSPSQREAVSCFKEIEEGEILAVNGPPGTGKTTLLQSIVANMYVHAALKKEKAPMIIATSTNNQAVTNIIESFEKINSIGIENLEKRWIEGVHSFAVYFPTKGKIKDAEKKNYHYTNVNGIGFVENIEDEENRVASKRLFLAEFFKYFGKETDSLVECNARIYAELRKVEIQRIECLELLKKISFLIGNQSCNQYINGLKKEVANRENLINDLNKKVTEHEKSGRNLKQRCNEWRRTYNSLPWYVRFLKFFKVFKKKIERWSYDNMQYDELDFLERGMDIDEIEDRYHKRIKSSDEALKRIRKKVNNIKAEKEKYIEAYNAICKLILLVKENLITFSVYKICITEKEFIENINIEKVNNYLDKVRYAEFWMAVHYYESLWLIEDNAITEKQKGKTFENVLNTMYERLAMLTPCMVMTCYMLPKQFLAYDGNEKKHFYMYNHADLLVVDEAGQISPEIGVAAFAFAKKAIVVGDEQQIPPVWSIPKALDIAMAVSNGVIKDKEDFQCIQNNGLNCSESSIMKIASLSCPFEKYGKGLFLSEHRRCYNEIVQYCNDLVYKGNLEPLRGKAERDTKCALKDYLPPMGYKQIDTICSEKEGTSRYNQNEAIEIVKWLERNYSIIVGRYRTQGTEEMVDAKNIVGIITPFKSQSVFIRKILREQLPSIEADIAVGTVHTFQGAERKIIIFSSVYGREDGCYFINKNKELMNVAVSRAKDSFLVFGERGCLVGNAQSAGGMLKHAVNQSID